jgi:hypothetical protein
MHFIFKYPFGALSLLILSAMGIYLIVRLVQFLASLLKV